MRIGRRTLLLATLAVRAGLLPARDLAQVSLEVRVYDEAALRVFELGNALAVAQGIFRGAGIEIRWAHCSTALRTGRDAPGCAGPLGATSKILKIVRRPLRECGPQSFGCALIDVGSGQGVIAYVFAQRLEESVPMSGAFRLLGFAMAHELGHLLLGAGSHSASGIMQPRLCGGVVFSDEQARQMRAGLRRAELAIQD